MQPTQPPTRGGGSSRPSSHPGFESGSAAAGMTGAAAGGSGPDRPDKGSPDACLSGIIAAAPDLDRGREESTTGRGGSAGDGSASGFAESTRHQARDLKTSAQHLARDAKQKAGEFAGQLKGGVKDGAQQATEQAKQAAFDAARMLRERGQEAFAQQKDRAADELGNVSAAIHKAGDKLDQEQDHNLACMVHGLADGVGRASDYVRRQDLGRLIDDAQRFGRQRPELLLGGMFVAGMALARFLKASRANPHAAGHSDADVLVRGNAGMEGSVGNAPSMPQAPSFNLRGESMATTPAASSAADLAVPVGQLPSPQTAVRGGSFVPTVEQDFEPAGGGTAGAGINPTFDTTTDTGTNPDACPPTGGAGGKRR